MIELLDRGSEVLWLGMLAHLWQTTLVLLVLALAARALRDAPARLLAAFWWLALLKLLLPLQILGPLTERLLDAAAGTAEPAAAGGGMTAITVWFYPAALRASGAGAALLGWIFPVLTAAWLTGIALLLARALRRGHGARPEPLPDDGRGRPLRRKLAVAAERAGIPAGIAIPVRGDRLPAVHGVLRARIAVPARLIRELPPDELTAILLHEEAHRRRRDPLRLLALRAVGTVFFFYPPVWWLLRRIHEATEMACDEAVLRAGVSSADYRRSLARALQLGLTPAGAAVALHGHRQNAVARRLRRLALPRRFRTMPRHRLVLSIGLLAVFGASLLPLAPTPSFATPPPAAGDSSPARSLDDLAEKDLMVMADFRETELSKIFAALEKMGTAKFELEQPVRDVRVTLETGQVPLRVALLQLAAQGGLRYEIVDPFKVIVRRKPLLAGVDDVTKPRLIPESKVLPEYPDHLRRAGVMGRVMLQALIDADGRVTEIEVLNTDQPDHPALADAAVAAVEQWSYEPATKDGLPVAVYFTIIVDFHLDEHREKVEGEKTT